MPKAFKILTAEPCAPKVAINIKASGTPPVFARTPLSEVTRDLSFSDPRTSITYAKIAPGIDANSAESAPSRMLFLNAVL